jgi:ABC-2 type transport system permease protein
MPVPGYRIFAARWIESLVDSSWMVVVFAVPLFAAYGMIFEGSWFYYFTLGTVLLLLSTCAATVSGVAMMGAVVLLPANRIRTIFVFVGLALFIGLYVGVRVIRPERLVDPEVFTSTLVYLEAMQTSPLPFLPSTWAYDALVAALDGQRLEAMFHLGLLLSFSLSMVFIMLVVADAIYFKGVSRAQSATAQLFKRRRLKFWGIKLLPLPVAALVFKEIKSFFRDQTQWSQLFLIFALIGIYVYNFKVLPLERSPMGTVFLGNLLAFLNMGLALFVLTAIAGRFVFPCVGMEGEAFWIIRSSPVTLGQFLWVKHLIYLVPLLVLTLVLIVATNLLLQVGPLMMALSLVNVFLMVPGVVSLGVGFGAIFADFKSENPAQTLSSHGGLLFMVFSVLFVASVIMIEAGPVYSIFKTIFHNRALGFGTILWAFLSFAAVAGLCVTTLILPMRLGKKYLKKRLCV